MTVRAFALATIMALMLPSLAVAQPRITVIPINFGGGPAATEIGDLLSGDEVIDYQIDVAAAQELRVEMKAERPAPYFNILPPSSGTALFVGSMEGTTFDGTLDAAGTYTIRVYQMGAARDENRMTEFLISVSLDGADSAASVGDFADAAAGGPDFWAVSGLRDGASLNVRSTPGGEVIMQIARGTVLRNLGCRTDVSALWCQVESPEGTTIKGWVSGKFLREAAIPATHGDALVAGTDFNATGELRCALEADPAVSSCPFGVKRSGDGAATVFITLPSGLVRELTFTAGGIAPMSGTEPVTATRSGDETTVSVSGSAEAYTIPDVVVQGD